jgi:hypothetical protein
MRRASEALTALLVAIGDASPGRRQRVEAVLDDALALSPGCDASNRFCDAEELDEEASYGCAVAGGGGALVVLALALLFGARRRAGAVLSVLSVLSVLLVLGFAAAPARADQRWHADARLGGSGDEPAVAMLLGVGVDRGRNSLGFGVEWNPWISPHAGRAASGSFNAILSYTRRWYVRPELSLYSRVDLGTSTILFELVGVDRYATGVFYGGVLLGVRIPLRPGWNLTFDPSQLAMPTPQISGIPFYYGQWRITLGLEAAL